MPEYRNATASLKENTAYVNEILPVQESFDIVQRNMMIGGREAAFFFVDGFTKDESMLKIMDSMMSITEEDMPKSATAFSKSPSWKKRFASQTRKLIKNTFKSDVFC